MADKVIGLTISVFIAAKRGICILLPAVFLCVNSFASEAGAKIHIDSSKNYKVIASDIKDGNNGTVIHIYDLHCDGYVQNNIAAILEELDSLYNLKHVYLEGADDKFDMSWADKILPSQKDFVLRSLVDNGFLTGAEYYAISKGKKFIKGLEKESVHKGNILRFSNIKRQEKELKSSIELIDRRIEALQTKYLGSHNKKLNKIIKKYRNSEIDAEIYYQKMFSLRGIDIKSYPEIEKYLYCLKFFKTVDSKKLDKEFLRFQQVLKETVSYKEYSEIAARNAELPYDRKAHEVFLRYNFDKDKRFLEIAKYFEYLFVWEQINPEKIIAEDGALTDAIREEISKDETERDIAFVYHYWGMLKDCLNLKISAKDYARIISDFGKFKFFVKKYFEDNDFFRIEPLIVEISRYYEINIARNDHFAGNIDMEQHEDSPAVVIAGGFHAKGLRELFEKKNVNFISIIPNMGSKKMFENYGMYEFILEKQALMFLNQTLAPAAGQIEFISSSGKEINLLINRQNVRLIKNENGFFEIENLVENVSKSDIKIVESTVNRSAEILKRILRLLNPANAPEIIYQTIKSCSLFLAQNGYLANYGLIYDIAQDENIRKILINENISAEELSMLPDILQKLILKHSAIKSEKEKKIRVLLVRTRLPEQKRKPTRWPGGLLALASSIKDEDFREKFLKNKGIESAHAQYDVNIIDLAAEEADFDFMGFIKSYKPDIVGISAVTPEIEAAKDLAKDIKAELPAITLIIGGHHVSSLPEETLSDSAFDIGVIGEGEETFIELLNAFAAGRTNFGNIAGLAVKKSNGEIITTQSRQFVMSADEYPLAGQQMDLLHLEDYAQINFNENKRLGYAGVLFTSRGCPGKCSFCAAKGVFGSKLHAKRSAQHIVSEVEYLYSRGINLFFISDDFFTVDKERVKELADLIEEKNMQLGFYVMTRADSVNEEIAKDLKRMGVESVAFGVESGDERILNEVIGKNISNARVIESTRIIKKYNMQVRYYMMVGLPEQNWESMKKSIDFILQASPDIVDIAVATPYPGSDLFGDPRIFTSVKYSDFRHNPESAPTKEKGIRPAVTRTGVMTSEDITLSAQLMRNIFDSRNNKKEFDKYMDELNKKVEAERQNAGKNEIQPPPSGVLNGVYVAVEKNEEMIFWNWQNTGLKTSRGEIIWMSVNDGKLILFANNAAHADVVEIFNNALFQSPSSARTAYISKLLNEKLAAVNIKIEKPVVVFNMSGHNRRYNSRHISFILSVA